VIYCNGNPLWIAFVTLSISDDKKARKIKSLLSRLELLYSKDAGIKKVARTCISFDNIRSKVERIGVFAKLFSLHSSQDIEDTLFDARPK
jgi:hypothetical protein